MDDMGYTDRRGDIRYWPGQVPMNVYIPENDIGLSTSKPLDLNYLQDQYGSLTFVTNTGTHLNGPLVLNKNGFHGGVFSFVYGAPTITYH
jgi:hypothetical protein